MTSLARWSPFKALSRFEQGSLIDDFFRDFGPRPQWTNMETPDMRIDVTENDDSYAVKAEVPGAAKDDIDVSINGNQITIAAEVKRETKRKDEGRAICAERYYGKVYRSFGLPADVDGESASAHYENGVLTLSLPKKQSGSARKLKVS